MTRNKSSRSILGAILVVWFAVGCTTASASPTPTPSATPAPTATATAVPTPTPAPTVGPGGFPRKFHVDGNAFVDQFGQKMIFRGVATLDPVLQQVDPMMPSGEDYYKAIASWGANIIRVPIVMLSIHQYGMDRVLTALDQTIAYARLNKMYVIIDFHTVGWIPDNWYEPTCCGDTKTSLQEWTEFWKAISSRYAGNNVVAFYELFNEPALPWATHNYPYPKSDWSGWKGLVDTLISNTIRPNDPEKIVLVGGLLSAYDLEYVAGAPIANSSNNVAYATHPYGTFLASQHLGWDTAFGNLSSKYPVFATEYGYGSPDTDANVGSLPYHQAVIDYLEAHHISWTVWNFSVNWPPALVTNNSTFEPSESGAYFKGRLRELNGPPSP